MSKVVKRFTLDIDPGHWAAIVESDYGQRFYVSSCWTLDYGYETMAFLCDKGNHVLSWDEVLTKRYHTYDDMVNGHDIIINGIENFLGTGVIRS